MLISEETRKKLAELKDKYPTRQASIMPALHLVFDEFGYLGVEQLDEAADIIGVSRLDMNETASFYTLFPKQKVGKYLIQVCTNLSCALMGADNLVEYLEEKLGIKLGETTPDGIFTLWNVECLGSCGTAPMMQVNDEYYEDLTREKVDELIENWRKGEGS
ncbi:MAG: NADH-quinone oxidoreductase subunit NuoE [candidate division Zixibacteria bacterium]|nr:NADH-quinone oxidoreductase subunit NuoE [candidate division Zixibacteria bacterium]